MNSSGETEIDLLLINAERIDPLITSIRCDEWTMSKATPELAFCNIEILSEVLIKFQSQQKKTETLFEPFEFCDHIFLKKQTYKSYEKCKLHMEYVCEENYNFSDWHEEYDEKLILFDYNEFGQLMVEKCFNNADSSHLNDFGCQDFNSENFEGKLREFILKNGQDYNRYVKEYFYKNTDLLRTTVNHFDGSSRSFNEIFNKTDNEETELIKENNLNGNIEKKYLFKINDLGLLEFKKNYDFLGINYDEELICSYNNDCQLNSVTIKKSFDIVTKTEYFYDFRKNIVGKKIYDNRGNLVKTVMIDYLYDTNGNWIVKRTLTKFEEDNFREKNLHIEIEKRKIQYSSIDKIDDSTCSFWI